MTYVTIPLFAQIIQGDLMTLKRTAFLLILVFALSSVSVLAASGNVDKKEYVCMMQDMVLGKPGIPIQYEGKTYYGCCEMCKEKIKNEPQRYIKAIDPVSQKPVDKASSFIYSVDGSAYYFTSDANRKTFAANPQKYIKK
jgi:YHS domain-containing protein